MGNDKDPVWVEDYELKINDYASTNAILGCLEAVVYFPEGAKVESPNLCGNFGSDQCLYYTDIDGTIGIFHEPYELEGELPEAVVVKLYELLGLSPHCNVPFHFITTN